MYNKMAVGSKVSMDGILDLTHPSAGMSLLQHCVCNFSMLLATIAFPWHLEL